MEQFSEAMKMANRRLGRLLAKAAIDQAGGRGYVEFFDMADRRIRQAEKVRLWVGLATVLFLLGALFGNDTFGGFLKGILFAALLGAVAFTVHRWRDVWIQLRLEMSKGVQSGESKEAYERQKAEYRESLEMASMSSTADVQGAHSEPSKAAAATAFAVGAVAGYKAVASNADEKREQRARQSRETDEARRRDERLRMLNGRAKDIAYGLSGEKNPDARRRLEAQLRQVEIEIQSVR